jgi:hypothetical protein
MKRWKKIIIPAFMLIFLLTAAGTPQVLLHILLEVGFAPSGNAYMVGNECVQDMIYSSPLFSKPGAAAKDVQGLTKIPVLHPDVLDVDYDIEAGIYILKLLVDPSNCNTPTGTVPLDQGDTQPFKRLVKPKPPQLALYLELALVCIYVTGVVWRRKNSTAVSYITQ